MNARRSHLPSCDTVPARSTSPRGGAWIAIIVVALLVPAGAGAQEPTASQRLRARGISIIEGLLTDTINEAIGYTVQAVNAANNRANEDERAAGEMPQLRYVIRSSGQTRARGMYLEDYGVIFTVQVPNLSYLHPALVQLRRGDGSAPFVTPGDPRDIVAATLAREAQLRNQLGRMREEMNTLTTSLENEIAQSGATSANAIKLRDLMGELQAVYDDFSTEVERLGREREREQLDPRSGPRREQVTPRSPLSIISGDDLEAVARAERLAIDQKDQVEGAVIHAVVDSLSYGHIFTDLDDDDRLAVVILPSSYLNQVVSWARATQRDEEAVISVRYGDVKALADGEMSAAEFGARIRLESLLGQPQQGRQR